MRTDSSPQTIFRKDYTPPAFLVDTVELGFDLHPERTVVASRVTLRQNPESRSRDIVLHGEEIELVQLRMNGKLLAKGDYVLDHATLTIKKAPAQVVLEIETLCAPVQNTTLSGLYVSNGNFFTQCEAEGFRRITFFPDRPDVMAKYTVMLRADKALYPVLLSNGNLIEEGDLDDGRHYAKWEDPFKKPSYLFALVAAKLVCQEEKFKLADGDDHEAVQVQFQAEAFLVPADRVLQRLHGVVGLVEVALFDPHLQQRFAAVGELEFLFLAHQLGGD